MTSFLLLLLLTASIPRDTYALAYKEAMKGEKPLVVFLHAEWCHPCRLMERSTLPRVDFKAFAFAKVDIDRERKLARKMLRGKSIPQLQIYYRHKGVWYRRVLYGYQPPVVVSKFLKQKR